MSLTFHTCLLHCGSGFRVALRRAVIVFPGLSGFGRDSRDWMGRRNTPSSRSLQLVSCSDLPVFSRFRISLAFLILPPCLTAHCAFSPSLFSHISSSPLSLTSLPHISVSLFLPLSCTHALFGASFRHLLSQKDLWPLFGRLWLTAVRFSQLSSVPFRQTVHSAGEPPARTPNQPRPGLPVSPPSFLETVGDQPISFS